ncbi:putative very-long-chain 3-oxoacyl-CoA reductase [Helianthus annuus]|nr:putative very-long-chain 3-oxoacyl-CoA reductase [Helianthus annuus]
MVFAGHFLLTHMLLDNMKKTARKSKKERRIVNVSSEAHRITYPEGICFEKINDETKYSKYQAYGQSKLANNLHANELTRQLKGAATTCYVALYQQVKGVSGELFLG